MVTIEREREVRVIGFRDAAQSHAFAHVAQRVKDLMPPRERRAVGHTTFLCDLADGQFVHYAVYILLSYLQRFTAANSDGVSAGDKRLPTFCTHILLGTVIPMPVAAYMLLTTIRTYDTIGKLVLPHKGVEGGKHSRLLEQLGEEVQQILLRKAVDGFQY